ncbi:MAG: type II toxin-antitoxin system RelE/ParE family toxin [bacterium]
MTFNIELSSRAADDLKKLSRTNRNILIILSKRISSLAENPYSGKPLKGNKKGCYSLRYGNYRIIYEIYPPVKTVLIIRTGHRKEIYR